MTAPSKLILASASPRRAEILKWAGVEIEIKPANIDETRKPNEEPISYALRLAKEKALALPAGPKLILGADTTVFIENQIFEKPTNLKEAANHLSILSGQTHQVVTAFALVLEGQVCKAQPVISQVTFRPLSAGMIDRYLATGESLDKAGAYGLQGLGGFLVEKIEGSHTNVIGLPLSEVLTALKKLQ